MKLVPCPICQKLSDWETTPTKPFCSERCKTMDLGNWASEKYRFEAKEESPSEESLANENDSPFRKKTP